MSKFKNDKGNAGLAVLAVVVAVVIGAAAFVGLVQIVNLNVNDIISHGVNFWNVFWLSLVATFWFGSSKAASALK